MSQWDDVPPTVSTTLSGESPSTTGDKNNSAANADVSSNDVQSRLSMSEEQREIKRRFEEKQRDEAQRSAHAERIAKKKASDADWNLATC